MSLSRRIKKLIKSHSIVSFDIFDTLLSRRFVHPYDVFGFIEQIYDCPGFKENRIAADWKARNKYKKDINLDEIYSVMPKAYAHLKQAELEIEVKNLYANPIGYQIFQYALQAGKTIICVSDMYFSKDFLVSVLKKNGITVSDVFVSNECNARKSDGTLYKYLAQEKGLNPRNIVHFGDTKLSDYTMARKNKLAAYKIPYIVDYFANHRENTKFIKTYNKLKNNPIASLFIGSYIKKWAQDKQNTDFWYSVGYSIYAPFIYGYTQFIRQNLKSETSCDLLFVARDGFLLKKCFDAFNTNAKCISHYIYAPRFVKILGDLDYSNKAEYLDTIIEYYSHKNADFRHVFACPKLRYAEKQKILADNLNLIKDGAAQLKARYIEYIKTIKLHSNECIMVDLSSGVMSSQRILNDVLPYKIKFGIYLSANGDLPHIDYAAQNSKQPIEMAPIFEILVSSDELSIADFYNGHVIYNDENVLEKDNKRLFARAAQGVLDCIQDIKDSGLYEQMHQLSFEWFLKYQNAFWQSLYKSDALKLRDCNWSYDAMNEKYINMYKYYNDTIAKKQKGLLYKLLHGVKPC